MAHLAPHTTRPALSGWFGLIQLTVSEASVIRLTVQPRGYDVAGLPVREFASASLSVRDAVRLHAALSDVLASVSPPLVWPTQGQRRKAV